MNLGQQSAAGTSIVAVGAVAYTNKHILPSPQSLVYKQFSDGANSCTGMLSPTSAMLCRMVSLTSAVQGGWVVEKMKRNVGGKRYEVRSRGAHLRLLGFLSLPNVPTIEPITAWTTVSSPIASTRYSISHLTGVRRALWANSGEGSAQ